ncbi:MAG: hypothetical protein AABP62_09690 [Planctomycetota bacterium]
MKFLSWLFGKENAVKAAPPAASKEFNRWPEPSAQKPASMATLPATRADPVRTSTEVDAALGTVLLKHEDFAISVPEGSTPCSVCSHPMYSEKKNDANILVPEHLIDDESIKRQAMRAFLLAAGTVCNQCNADLCWNCVVTVGLGACPKCFARFPANHVHAVTSADLFDDDQKAEVFRAVLTIRKGGERGDRVPELAGQRLKSLGWDDADAYFAQLYALGVNGSIVAMSDEDEAQLRSELGLEGNMNERKIIVIPAKAGRNPECRVVAGTAFIETGNGGRDRVMAEFEDGQVRCVIESLIGDMFISLINGRP